LGWGEALNCGVKRRDCRGGGGPNGGGERESALRVLGEKRKREKYRRVARRLTRKRKRDKKGLKENAFPLGESQRGSRKNNNITEGRKPGGRERTKFSSRKTTGDREKKQKKFSSVPWTLRMGKSKRRLWGVLMRAPEQGGSLFSARILH